MNTKSEFNKTRKDQHRAEIIGALKAIAVTGYILTIHILAIAHLILIIRITLL